MHCNGLVLAAIIGVAASACGSGWTQAGNKCFKLIGGRLASIASMAENEVVRKLAARREIYIGGLSYQGGPWTWADSSPFGAYSNWAAGSEPAPTPARPCIKMNYAGQWFSNCCRTPSAAGVCSKSA